MNALLDESAIQAEAKLLDEAEQQAKQIRQTTAVYTEMGIEDAYAIQNAWCQRRLDRGERLVGHKIGLTSRAMQKAMNIETPDSGFITDVMVFAPDSELEAENFCDPKLEVELAFVLAQDLAGADLSIEDVLAATEYVTPAAELIAARSFRHNPKTGRTRTVVDTISDNAANAGMICGGNPVAPEEIDLRWVAGLAYRNGVIEETGVAAGVLDHPATGIIWLCRRYAEQGLSLKAGQTILAGSFTRPIDVRPGDEFLFDFDALGSFKLAFKTKTGGQTDV